MNLQVYIPTMGRVGHMNQITLREFQQLSDHVPIIVCPLEEAAAHKKYSKRVVVCEQHGIGKVRQWILENSDADIVVMADDDMYFSYRPVPDQIKLERCKDLRPLLKFIEALATPFDSQKGGLGYIHGGVGARQGNNRKAGATKRDGEMLVGHWVVLCERVNNFHFFHRKAFLAQKIRFDHLPVMEDFFVTLSLLTRGFPNVVIHDYVWNQRGSGAIGGCSSYRTAQVQAQGAEGLHKAFPQFVRVVEKESKDTSPSWREFKSRKDVIVSWWKAWKHGDMMHSQAVGQ